ncbi:hypothetical protein MtrunA17_Chr8g0368561 [Medicago truncatula]|uniref:Uncharacterized protein n=1 Tax=Medicago truncatula TaxID=3880 RepID=A0A396GQ53_MEDTR|nr:hypothetical protein MtrunA17_Chr8g0368561 [Medicago truncatula]
MINMQSSNSQRLYKCIGLQAHFIISSYKPIRLRTNSYLIEQCTKKSIPHRLGLIIFSKRIHITMTPDIPTMLTP